MAEKEKNVKIDETEKTVTITLNPRLYSQNVIMRAAYRFTEDFEVAIDGDPLETIIAVFKIKKEDEKDASKKDLVAISDAFYSELLHASVEDAQARRYADTRNALIGAAVRQLMPTNVDPRAIAETLNSYADKKEKTPAQENPADCDCNSGGKEDKKTTFELVYQYMPKQNCGRCGRDCEETAKKIAAGECGTNVCFHLKTKEFSVVREELEKILKKSNFGTDNYGQKQCEKVE